MKFQRTDRKVKLFFGGSIALLLILSPFLFYLYRLAPQDSNYWKTPLFSISSGGFGSVQSFAHAFFTKLLFIIYFTIWFLTAKDWWKYAILVPLTMFLFQLSGVINYSIQYIDEYDFWYSLPVVMPVIVFLIWLSRKLRFYNKALDIKEQIDKELQAIQKKKK